MKIFSGFLVFIMMSVLSYSAKYDKEKAAMLSLSCTACHGSNGKSVSNHMPTIAGQSKEVLFLNLKAFREGTRTGTIMQKHTKGFSIEELEQISYHFSNQ